MEDRRAEHGSREWSPWPLPVADDRSAQRHHAPGNPRHDPARQRQSRGEPPPRSSASRRRIDRQARSDGNVDGRPGRLGNHGRRHRRRRDTRPRRSRCARRSRLGTRKRGPTCALHSATLGVRVPVRRTRGRLRLRPTGHRDRSRLRRASRLGWHDRSAGPGLAEVDWRLDTVHAGRRRPTRQRNEHRGRWSARGLAARLHDARARQGEQ